MEGRMFLRSAAVPFTSFVGYKTVGPHLVACCYLPPAEKYPGHPDYKPAPPATLDIQASFPSGSVSLVFAEVFQASSTNNIYCPELENE